MLSDDSSEYKTFVRQRGHASVSVILMNGVKGLARLNTATGKQYDNFDKIEDISESSTFAFEALWAAVFDSSRVKDQLRILRDCGRLSSSCFVFGTC